MRAEISGLLEEAVPPMPDPDVNSLWAKSRWIRKRRWIAVRSGLAVCIVAVIAFVGSGTWRQEPELRTLGRLAFVFSDEEVVGRALNCERDSVVMQTEYAPLSGSSADEVLQRQLDRYPLEAHVEDFSRAYESEDLVGFALERDGRVLAIASAIRVGEIWELGGFAVCAEAVDQ